MVDSTDILGEIGFVEHPIRVIPSETLRCFWLDLFVRGLADDVKNTVQHSDQQFVEGLLGTGDIAPVGVRPVVEFKQPPPRLLIVRDVQGVLREILYANEN